MSIEDTVGALVADLKLGDTLPSRDPRASIRSGESASAKPVGLTTVRVAEREQDDGTALEIILGSELGRGGMGVVRAAWQVPLGREVAVKLLRDATSEPARRGLLHEAMITGALEHPNIPPVHFLASDDHGQPLLVMKRIDGTSWRAMLDDPDHKRWSVVKGNRIDWCLGVLMQIANAVHFAHTHGYLHRDLKPDNVMIGDFGEVYVLDWGIAARIDDLAHADVDTFRLVGTPAYVAPEMVDRQMGPADQRTDVFLLGGLLYHALCGVPPHAGGDTIDVLIGALTPCTRTYPTEVPTELAAITDRALAFDPDERFASAEELRATLAEFMDTRESVRLVRQAADKLERLTNLETNTPRFQMYRIFGECRFAFEEALQLRPDLAVARRGLHDARVTVARLDLEGGYLDGAELVVEELDPDDADRIDLAARIHEARSATARRSEDHERLQSLEADIDIDTGSRARAYAVLGVACAITLIGVAALETFNVIGPQSWMAGRLGLIVFLVVTGGLAHRVLFRNQASRRLALAVFALGVTAAMHLWLALVLRQPIEVILPTDMFIFGVGLSLIAITLGARTELSAVVALGAAFIGAYRPLILSETVAVALVAIVGIQVLFWGFAARRKNIESR